MSLTLVSEGKAAAVIVTARNASEQVQAAARLLGGYLRRISGAHLPIRHTASAGACIWVGPNPALRLGVDVSGLGPEGIRLATVGENLVLTGADDQGVEFAVYTFLDECCGVRWFWPGDLGEEVPRNATITIGPVDVAHTPSYRRRAMNNNGRWQRLNRMGGCEWRGDHAWHAMVPPKEYADTHPEYYPLLEDGKRHPEGIQLCTSNPEVKRLCAEYVARYFDDHPEVDSLSISPGDGQGFCLCDDCRALDGDRPLDQDSLPPLEISGAGPYPFSLTERLFTFANAVGAEVAKTHPDKHVVMLAYTMSYVDPPQRLKVRDNVIVWYCVSCVGHWHEARRKLDYDRLAGWNEAASQIGIYEYYLITNMLDLPRLVLPLAAESIRRYHELGARYFRTQSADDFALHGPLYYLAAKLLWDVEADPETILGDYFDTCFGPAGDAIRRYYDALGEGWKKATAKGDLIDSRNLLYTLYYHEQILRIYSPDILDRCATALDEAAQLAGSDRHSRRVAFVRKGFEYTRLSVEAARATKAVEALGLPRFGPYGRGERRAKYSLDEAAETLKTLDRREALSAVTAALRAWNRRRLLMDNLHGQNVVDLTRYGIWNQGFDSTPELLSLLEKVETA